MSNKKGFTVVELIVAMGVFVVIVTIAVGVFVGSVRNQRLLTELMAVNNNAGGVLEQMAREIRTGYRFDATADALTFTNYKGETVTSTLAAGKITRQAAGRAAHAMTADEVEVTYLTFLVSQKNQNADPSDDVCNPWRITILMGVRSRNPALADREIKLQTTVSSRVFPAEAPNAPEEIILICA